MGEIIILTIDLGQAKGEIQIEPESEPEDLARLFCRKYCLDFNVEKSLVCYLKKNFFTVKDGSSNCSRVVESPKASPIHSPKKNTQISPACKKVPAIKTEACNLPGERLYNKAINALQLKRKTENDSKNTSRPSSSRTAISPTRLMQSLKKTKEKLEVKKKFYAKEEMKECTFKPDINSKSPYLRKSSSKLRTTLLYEDHKIKQNKLLNKSELLLKKQCPFTPNIRNKSKEKVVLSKTIERLQQFRENSQMNLEKMRAVNRKMSEFDPETGQKYFKPKVHQREESREKPVWEELYESSKKISSSPLNSSRKLLIDKNSQKINNKIRHKQYLKIFKDLSKDGEIIRYCDIKFDKADKNMVEILNPVFIEMGEKNIELVFEEFCQALDALFKVLTPQEKSYLLFSYTSDQD